MEEMENYLKLIKANVLRRQLVNKKSEKEIEMILKWIKREKNYIGERKKRN